MTVSAGAPITYALAVIVGFGLRSLIDIILEWRANRPRRFKLDRDYFDPCGPECRARGSSEIGWRSRHV